MTLITHLKVSEVVTLGDARAAAGFGADFIAMPFIEEEGSITPSEALEIARWVEGPIFVPEFDNPSQEFFDRTVKALNARFAQINEMHHTLNLGAAKQRLIQNINLGGFRDPADVLIYIEESPKTIKYWELTLTSDEFEDFMAHAPHRTLIRTLCEQFPVFLNFPFTPQNIRPIVEKYRPLGINLYAPGEESTGEGDYDLLQAIVEQLEE